MAKNPDVVVVGGGVIGLTTAYFLAKTGLAVEVLDRADLGREASWAGAGIIPPGNPERAASPLDRLRALGASEFPRFSSELQGLTGIDNGYRRCGGIEYLQPGDDNLLDRWRDEGIEFAPIGGSDLHPVMDNLGMAYYLPGFAQVRNPWHIRALIAACTQVGVKLQPGCAVAGWARVGQRVVGIQLTNGETIAAGRFLLAAGAWCEALLGGLGLKLGVAPVRGQIVLLRTHERLFKPVLLLGKEYLVPRDDGRVLVGSTEEPEAGFEKVNTAEAVAKLLELAQRVVPALAGAELERCWAGLRPGSPDGLPFLGPVPGWENVFVSTGHFRAGIQLSIGSAQAMADLITGRTPGVPLQAFALDREPNTEIDPAFRS